MDANYYLDGYILPIKREDIGEYQKIAKQSAEIFIEYGALAVWECLNDDTIETGTQSFRKTVKAEADETVILSWVLFRSKEHRNQVVDKFLVDERMKEMIENKVLKIGVKRMIYGSFSSLIVK